jgi:hypothetical protein
MASHEQNESLITYFYEMLAPNNLSNELKTITWKSIGNITRHESDLTLYKN